MSARRRLLIPAAVLTLTPLLSAQTAKQQPAPKPSLLKLEVIPAKRTYRVGEAIVVKYKLTNLSDKTICFPRPGTKTEDEAEGYVRTIANGSGGEAATFIEGFYPIGVPDQELVNRANEKWLKLAPGLSYVTAEARPLPVLAAGDWSLQSKYSPPYLRGRGRLIVDALSCTPPEIGATSGSVKVSVVTPLESQ